MQKKITYQRLYNITLYYLSRFDANTVKVRQMLRRRLQKVQLSGNEVPAEAEQWIEDVIVRMHQLGYINDERYCFNQVRILSDAGKSKRFIIGKLKQAGVSPDLIDKAFEEEQTDDLLRAKKFVKRKKIGCFRPQSERMVSYPKDLAALGRAGFSYEVSVLALKQNEEF